MALGPALIVTIFGQKYVIRGLQGLNMAEVTLTNVRKSYGGGVVAVKDFNLHIADHEFVVLVGPSGCGKSTTLRMVAGLEDITGGTIAIGDRVVNGLQPKDRDIAMVFQNYALYQHMSVYDNLAFGLRNRSVPESDDRRGRSRSAAKMLSIEPLLDRRPRQLSGGQQQRVALGPLHRAQSQGVPVRRAAVQPGRPAARADAPRDQGAAPARADHLDVRHPRPGRGHDAWATASS